MKTGEFAQYSRCFGLDGLEVMSARWMEHSFAPHMHDFYAVSLNYGGRGAFDCRRELHDAAPGTCNLIAPGELHTGHATSADGWTYRNLYVETTLMTVLLRSLDRQGPSDVRFKFPLGERHRFSRAAGSRFCESGGVEFAVAERIVAIVCCGAFGHGSSRARALPSRCGAGTRSGPASQGLVRSPL